MDTIKIYTLSDNNGIKYVGKTNNIKNRYNRHIFDAKNKLILNKRDSWIKSLISKSEKPILHIIDEVSVDDWCFWEMYWIEQFINWGFKLKNMTKGGEGTYGRFVSEETKSKMSNTKKGITPKNLYLLHKSTIKGSILQYTLEGELLTEWESVGKAKTKLNINNIDLVVKRKRSSAGGFIWRYSNEPITIEEIDNITEKHNKQKSKPILQFTLDNELVKEWKSVGEVKKIYQHINPVLNGKRNTAGGFIWRYK